MNIYRFRYLVLSAVLALAFFIMPTTTMAQTTMCDGGGTVGSGDGEIYDADLPLTISDSGIWCLMEDVSYSYGGGHPAIKISSDDVVLDLNDHVIDGNTGDSAVQVREFDNITVKNGTIKGFYNGIHISNFSNNYLIEGLTITDSYSSGIYHSYSSSADSHTNIVRNNRIINTSGHNVPEAIRAQAHIINNDVTGVSGVYAGYGILAAGKNSIVLNNRVNNINVSEAVGSAKGIFAVGDNLILESNSISGVISLYFSYGIDTYSTGSNEDIINNRVTNVTDGGSGGIGYYLSSSTSRYRDNIASAVTTGYSGSGDDLGNND